MNTIVITKEQLQRFIQDRNIKNQAAAMEQMREIMYSFVVNQCKIPIKVVKDEVIIKFEI